MCAWGTQPRRWVGGEPSACVGGDSATWVGEGPSACVGRDSATWVGEGPSACVGGGLRHVVTESFLKQFKREAMLFRGPMLAFLETLNNWYGEREQEARCWPVSRRLINNWYGEREQEARCWPVSRRLTTGMVSENKRHAVGLSRDA